jgi:serine/threonine-protein kinase Chk1
VSSVYRAANLSAGTVAAVKVVLITAQTTELERKALDREMRIHGALDHVNILHFIDAVVVDGSTRSQYIPAVYMLLELAAGGDLFDKIGAFPSYGIGCHVWSDLEQASAGRRN